MTNIEQLIKRYEILNGESKTKVFKSSMGLELTLDKLDMATLEEIKDAYTNNLDVAKEAIYLACPMLRKLYDKLEVKPTEPHDVVTQVMTTDELAELSEFFFNMYKVSDSVKKQLLNLMKSK